MSADTWIDYSGLIPGAVYGRAEVPQSRSKFGITFIFACQAKQSAVIVECFLEFLLGVIISSSLSGQYILLPHTAVQSLTSTQNFMVPFGRHGVEL